MCRSQQAWLAAHPYLEPMARIQRIIDEAADQEQPPALRPVCWDSYAEDQAEGIPLLHSASAGIDFTPAAADMLGQLVERVVQAPLPGNVGLACRELRDAFRTHPAACSRAVEWIVRGAKADEAPAHGGVARFLGWAAARHVLEPLFRGPATWREEGRWGLGYCPTCGSLPLMAQLVRAEEGRQRFLACGCCGTRWKYRRIGCPFCGTEAADQLGILQVEGEENLRIDVCSDCHGYLKTYSDEGEEDLYLADWPTLHLDLLAKERGLRQLGASLYGVFTDERRTKP